MVKQNSKRKNCRGAVSMEYVIIAVLIAAACVIAVVVFSRAMGGGFITASRGASGDHTQAAEKLHCSRKAATAMQGRRANTPNPCRSEIVRVARSRFPPELMPRQNVC